VILDPYNLIVAAGKGLAVQVSYGVVTLPHPPVMQNYAQFFSHVKFSSAYFMLTPLVQPSLV